jgi:hypothetical protein
MLALLRTAFASVPTISIVAMELIGREIGSYAIPSVAWPTDVDCGNGKIVSGSGSS